MLFYAQMLHAVEPKPSVMDTILLDEIVTYADYRKYQPGAKIISFNIQQTQASSSESIDQLISRHAPIYIKSDAGGLSTIRIRGTSPSHTTVNFGGININSLTLGQSNMSKIPVYLFDRFDLQYGASSALNGSGAIGGAIYLEQNNRWIDGVLANVISTHGSFGEHQYGARIHLGNGKLESVTRAYHHQKENNFPFKNPYTGNIENREPVDDIQKGAAHKSRGIIQEINYMFTPNEFIRNMLWYNDSWYQIQPNMQSNLNFRSTEEMNDKNLRIWSEYKNENNLLKFDLGAGFVHDYQVYNHNMSQQIIVNRALSQATLKHTINPKTEYKLGAKYQYIVPEVYSYSAEKLIREQHIDLYLLWFYQPSDKLKTSLNMRQMFVTNFNAPFTPSLGAEYELVSTQSQHIIIDGNISRSYRIPTLNDRYWGTQGNPNLKPEEGINVETGIKYHVDRNNSQSSISANIFHMDIDNWIEWRNFGVWQARNVQRVISRGVETHSNIKFKIANVKSDISLNYTFNKAEIVAENEKRQQLIYSPVHIANLSYFAQYNNIQLFVDGKYTGKRKSNYLGQELPHYFITNINASYNFSIKNQALKVSMAVNNVFNTNYENEKYYAMPGINFKLGISATIHSLFNQ